MSCRILFTCIRSFVVVVVCLFVCFVRLLVVVVVFFCLLLLFFLVGVSQADRSTETGQTKKK